MKSMQPSAHEPFLESGTMLDHYRILAPLGAGGMGVVYLASDERLKRNVALKLLPDSLIRDESRLQRFTLEAQAASALNHPSIVTIYEIGMARDREHDRPFIAMELIDGKTLREQPLNRGNLKKLLGPFIEAAEGLARAHLAGIVHRDLKPENIMITDDGRAKIVDFGLAKLLPFQDELQGDDTTVAQRTAKGAVMGTVGYMSPEQVEARTIDHRSDIFSLGCVLYESVTGDRAFAGDSAIDILHMIVHTEARPVGEINSSAPDELIRVIERCLAKDPDERFQSVKEIAIELRGVLREKKERSQSRKRWTLRRRLFAGTAILSAIAAAALAMTILSRTDPGLSAYRFTPLETTPQYEGFPAWSPDGKTIAYVTEVDGVLQVFTRSLTSTGRARITNQPRDCREPFWSPDGSRIYFISIAGSLDALWMVSAGGGAAQLVMPRVLTAAISPDGKMLAVLREEGAEYMASLQFANASGEDARKFEHRDFGNRTMSAGALRFSPDGRKLGAWLFTRGGGAPREFWEISIPAMTPRRSLPALSAIPRSYRFDWLPDSRHIIFGGPVPGPLTGNHLWLGDTRSGRLQPLTATPAQESNPSVAPDGKRIVFTTEEADFDLMSISLVEDSMTPLLASARVERFPAWAPGSSMFAFVTDRNGSDEVWLRSTTGDFERPIVTSTDFSDGATTLIASIAFSPDGQRIAYQRGGGNYRIWISAVAGGPPLPLNQKRLSFEDHPTWSPDNEWMAFTATPDPSGFPSLMKVRLGIDSPPTILLDRIVMSGDVKWSPTGEWIACERNDGITLVSPDGKETRLLSDSSWLTFDWSRDGKNLYAIRSDEALQIALIKIDVATGEETIVRELGPSPPANHPFQGLSIGPDAKSVATSMIRLRGDLWLVEGWKAPRSTFRWWPVAR